MVIMCSWKLNLLTVKNGVFKSGFPVLQRQINVQLQQTCPSLAITSESECLSV